jgi:hypothetical protein
MRVLLLLLAIVAVAGFAAQNRGEIMRSSDLMVGPVVTTAPMGLILLGLLALGLVVFLLASAASRTRELRDMRESHRSLEAQRELADKAEASRFTELRQHLDRTQLDLRTELSQMKAGVMSRLAEMESRFNGRAATGGWNQGTPLRSEEPRGEHALADVRAEHARAELAREEAMRDEQRLREEERVRTEGERRPGLFSRWR